jgi:protocatechuate 3,4-dioxygenase beta subunit
MPAEPHDHDRGLAFDLSRLVERRSALKLLAGLGFVTVVGCGSGHDKTAAGTTTSSGASQTTAVTSAGCTEIPAETAGPYPGDGTNGPDALTQNGIVRSDIRSSFGANTGTAMGVPLTVNLVVLDAGRRCAALAGAAVYLWHCNRDGLYSMYGRGITDQNYLRGVQKTDGDGRVTFKSIFPAAYSGRWPHIHFEVYSGLAKATTGGGKIATSQLALPEDACRVVYASPGYGASIRHLDEVSLARDNVFGDGYSQQLASVAGRVADGYTAELSVRVNP